MIGLIGFLIVSFSLTIGTLSKPQFENIEIYEVDLTSNHYQNNPFLNSHSLSGNNNNQYSAVNKNHQDKDNLSNPQTLDSCDSYWSYQKDFDEKIGVITIPEPFYKKSFLRIQLSLAARLLTVCKSFLEVSIC